MATPALAFIKCTGTPRDMGRQYGEQARAAIQANAAFWRCEPTAAERPGVVAAMLAVLARHAPEVLTELEGLAEASGISLGGLLLANSWGAIPSCCTSMALHATPDGPLLGKNNDGDATDRVFVVRHSRPARGLPLLQVTYAGWLSGLDAMNAAGVANGHNSVGSRFPPAPEGVDIRLWAYHLLRHETTTAGFVAGLAAVPLLGKGFNVVVNDAAGDVAVVEAAVPRVAVRGRGEPFVYAVNHYVGPGLEQADRRTPRAKEISTYRYGYLRWRDQTARPAGLADLSDLLASHEPWAPCRHGAAHEAWTLWSMIAQPAARRLLVAPGPPCTNAYVEYSAG